MSDNNSRPWGDFLHGVRIAGEAIRPGKVVDVNQQRKRDEFALEDHEWRKETIYIGAYGKKKVLMFNDEGMKKLILQSKSQMVQIIQRRVRNLPANGIPVKIGF
jgi:hypothetical protein